MTRVESCCENCDSSRVIDLSHAITVGNRGGDNVPKKLMISFVP